MVTKARWKEWSARILSHVIRQTHNPPIMMSPERMVHKMRWEAYQPRVLNFFLASYLPPSYFFSQNSNPHKESSTLKGYGRQWQQWRRLTWSSLVQVSTLLDMDGHIARAERSTRLPQKINAISSRHANMYALFIIWRIMVLTPLRIVRHHMCLNIPPPTPKHADTSVGICTFHWGALGSSPDFSRT